MVRSRPRKAEVGFLSVAGEVGTGVASFP
jgi:hypothetical protein